MTLTKHLASPIIAFTLVFWGGSTIGAVNTMPTIRGVPDLKVRVGSPFSFTPSTVDPDGDSLTFSIANKPRWLQFNPATGVLSGTPTNGDVGLTPTGYVISVGDGKGGSAKLAAYHIKVMDSAVVSNTPPVISGVPSLKVNVGESFSFIPIARDANNDTLTFSIANKPSWASFNPSTGALTGKPTEADAGLSPQGYVISVSDGKGGASSLAAFNIKVIGSGSVANKPPVISGTPITAAAVASNYSFTPVASDAENDTLTYSIVNKPAWTTFDNATGRLQGSPLATDIGTTADILIRVSDGNNAPVDLPAFSLTVADANNLARQYGTASQSTTYSPFMASNAIDGNAANFSHTNVQGNDWWQVKFPGAVTISSLVIKNRNDSSLYSRLAGVKVYVTNSPYSANLSAADEVAVMQGIATNTVMLSPARSGSYVILKANSTSYLSMAEVEVYGVVPEAPSFEQNPFTFTIAEKSPKGAAVGKVKAADFQQQPLSYSLQGNGPFLMDAQGNITLNGKLDHNLVTSYRLTATASDGTISSSVPVIINVAPANLAFYYGAASQSTTYTDTGGTYPAVNAIDGKLGNFNHTLRQGGDWWQVKLPRAANINRIIVKNRDSSSLYGRLEGATVYVSNSPYRDRMNEAEKVATLTGVAAIDIALNPARSGAYVIVKASASNPLSMAELEVYAQTSEAPIFDKPSYVFNVNSKAAIGALVGTTPAFDYQDDAFTYTIDGTNLFAVDAQGNIKVNGVLQSSTVYNFTVKASDGVNTGIATVQLAASSETAVPDAIRTADATNVSAPELVDEALSLAQTQFDHCKTTLSGIYPNGLEKVLLPRSSIYTSSFYSGNLPLHVAVDSKNLPQVASWVGQKASGQRYAFLGADVFGEPTINTALKNGTLNMLRWLLSRNSSVDLLNEPLTVLVPRAEDVTLLNKWFTDNGMSHRWAITRNTDLLATGAFDFYLGNVRYNPLSEFQQAFASGKPVIGVNNWYSSDNTSPGIFAEFGLIYGLWGDRNIGSYDTAEAQCSAATLGGASVNMLNTLKNGMPDLIYDPPACTTKSRIDCDMKKVADASGNNVANLFTVGMLNVRRQLQTLDLKNISAFSYGESENLLKLLVLMGDKYRSFIQYPMDKSSTDDTTFYQAMFADNAVHYARANNPYQPDMGKFGGYQAELNAEVGTSKLFTATPTIYDEWTSTGFYLPPGKTITVRRTDSSAATVKLRFNFQRNTTWVWNTDDYNRPLYLSSSTFILEPNKTYTYSSPYGGPVYIGWDAVATGAVPFTVELNGITKSPLLQQFDTAAIQAFQAELEATNSGWVDIKTPYAEIHTLKSYLIYSFNGQDGNRGNGYTAEDVQAYLDNINNYLIAGNYAYAGFVGAGLPPLHSEVQALCTRMGLTNVNYDGRTTNLCTDAVIHLKPKIQHINAEVRPACGAMCSGNPFDSGEPLDPFGWLDNHEMGHNLQRGRLNIYDDRSGEVANNIMGLHTRWAQLSAEGRANVPYNGRPSNEVVFNILQSAIATAKPANINHPLWFDNTSIYSNDMDRLAFYQQLIYSEQTWQVHTMLSTWERIFADAIKTDGKWNTVKDLLGFGNYTRTEAAAMTSNDFMYVALSVITERNYSDFFEVWGVGLSQKAKDQVLAYNIVAQVPRRFYYVPPIVPIILPTIADTIPLDGVSPWVDPTP